MITLNDFIEKKEREFWEVFNKADKEGRFVQELPSFIRSALRECAEKTWEKAVSIADADKRNYMNGEWIDERAHAWLGTNDQTQHIERLERHLKPSCACDEPWTKGVVHRVGKPCYWPPTDTEPDKDPVAGADNDDPIPNLPVTDMKV